MDAVPGFIAVTKPVLSTFSTSSLLDFQVTDAGAAPSGSYTALSCVVV